MSYYRDQVIIIEPQGRWLGAETPRQPSKRGDRSREGNYKRLVTGLPVIARQTRRFQNWEPFVTDTLSEILTPEELATLLRVSPAWVHEKTRRRAQNPLPTLRIGRYIRFRRSDVIAWLDGTREPAKKGRR